MYKINNPLRLTDWEYRKFIILILTILISFLATVFINVGIDFSILRNILGFIFITFVPGLLLIRILRIRKISSIETLLYVVGLSVSTIFFIGVFIDLVYPLFGIHKPLSEMYVIATFSVFTLILCIISYIRDDGYSNPDYITLNDYLSPQALFLYLIPFLSIIGSYLVNIYNSYFLLMIMVLLISVVVLLISVNKISPKLYPLCVFVISISLLFHYSLISMNLVEWGDVSFEFFSSSTVLTNSIWLPSLVSNNLNSTLSIVILTPIYSIITGLQITWLFKIVFPMIYALVPLGLYEVFKKQTYDKVAFLSIFFFISTFSFFTVMLGLNRQQFGELFLVLIVLLLINNSMNQMKKTSLLILFAISLVLAHYAFANIFIIALLFVMIIVLLSNYGLIPKYSKIIFKNSSSFSKEYNKNLTIGFTILFIVFSFSWFLFTSNGSIFTTITNVGSNIVSNLFTEFLNPSSVQGLLIVVSKSSSILGYIYKVIYFITQLFIVVGIYLVLFKREKFSKMNLEFIILSVPFLLMDIAGLMVPFFASAINTPRLYHISIIFLSLFAVIGGISLFKQLKFGKNAINMLSIFLVIYFLFNVGLIYDIAGEHSSSSMSNAEKLQPHFSQNEVNSILWLNNNSDIKNNKANVYADANNAYLIEMIFGQYSSLDTVNYVGRIQHNYFFVGQSNVITNQLVLYGSGRLSSSTIPFDNISGYLDEKNLIYSGNDTAIYY